MSRAGGIPVVHGGEDVNPSSPGGAPPRFSGGKALLPVPDRVHPGQGRVSPARTTLEERWTST
jgi:hypothetical protein